LEDPRDEFPGREWLSLLDGIELVLAEAKLAGALSDDVVGWLLGHFHDSCELFLHNLMKVDDTPSILSVQVLGLR